ncbi:uncharacterized protein SPSK_03051 [Sporothrix schenckii 1099-18]|uniref:Uncharacterized protein n=1 Tax=Sporothrix schenckii 1099-18 TaxID=1397361 RepID=A0A0F2LXP9_SPOSC|nr:uncharacterized protein SPSK_03051 [Sporothrix schenckii 1099-18]KJR82242.1 hypothetical protein SPSK_03051 [Sporothrix schenckii 1099-18]
MDEGDREPGPLRIIKRTSNPPIQPSAGDSAHGSGSDHDQLSRRASAATDESMDSIQEGSGASQRSLSIPKKRRTLLSQVDGGASRFYAAPEAHAAGMARRRRNDTDSFGSGSDHSDIGMMNGRSEASGGFASVRTQYLRDGYRAEKNDYGLRSLRPSSSHSSSRLYEEEDALDNFQRMRLSSEAVSVGIGDVRRDQQGDYDAQSKGTYSPHASDECFIWPSDRPYDCERRTGMLPASSGRHGAYNELLMHPGLHPRQSHRQHTYDSRPVSTSDILATGPELFQPQPYTRPRTAIPFNSPYKSHRASESFHYRQDTSRSHHSRRLSQVSAKSEVCGEVDPQILVPIVSVTPECRTVEGDVNSFWVAIELFAHVTQPLDTGSSRDHRFRQDYHQASTSSFATDDDQGLYRFGYISDMDIKIVSSYQSEILEVIGKSPSLLTLLPGSRRLMVVHIHLDMTKKKQAAESQEYRPLSHSNTSDQLLEDLELHLGSTSQEYMQIQLTYSHSGFPKRDVGRDPMDRDGGCVEVRTTIETTVTALVMQQNSASMWSPSAAPPGGSPLVDIVAKHWGPAAAKEMAKRIATSIEVRMLRRTDKTFRTWDTAARHTNQQSQSPSQTWRPSTPENGTQDGSLDEVTPRAVSHSHQPSNKKSDRQEGGKRPARNTSLGQSQQPIIPVRMPKKDYQHTSDNAAQRSASSSISQKRVSLSQVPRLSVSSANIPTDSDPPSPGCLLPRSKNSRLASGGPRQVIPDAAPRNIRRLVGMDTTHLQNVPLMPPDQSLKSENCGDRMQDHSGIRSSSRSSTISKRSGKWPWPGWFS